MGWSCTAAASRRLDSWRGVCVASTGSQNVYKVPGGERRVWELDGIEHADGAITGVVWSFDFGGMSLGQFRVDPDGTVSAWPAGLRDLVNSQGWERSRRSGFPSTFGGGRS